ncbi:MAG: hypothetical protein AVDCRST_MAG66-4630, partial [uncultured Pseudonocardia sp.]
MLPTDLRETASAGVSPRAGRRGHHRAGPAGAGRAVAPGESVLVPIVPARCGFRGATRP